MHSSIQAREKLQIQIQKDRTIKTHLTNINLDSAAPLFDRAASLCC